MIRFVYAFTVQNEVENQPIVGDVNRALSYIPLIDKLRGRPGRDGMPGRDGLLGEQGLRGPAGTQGLPGPVSAGVTYIRWGRTSCPEALGTEVVYSGRAAGTYYAHKGGSAENVCLPNNPDYLSSANGVQGSAYLVGAEYKAPALQTLSHLNNHNVPCAVCYVPTRAAMIMIPAKTQCPTSWTVEYAGYLMTENYTHHRSTFSCVDKDAQSIPGGVSNEFGALFYHVEATCIGILCPPYDTQRELTCAVCTK